MNNKSFKANATRMLRGKPETLRFGRGEELTFRRPYPGVYVVEFNWPAHPRQNTSWVMDSTVEFLALYRTNLPYARPQLARHQLNDGVYRVTAIKGGADNE